MNVSTRVLIVVVPLAVAASCAAGDSQTDPPSTVVGSGTTTTSGSSTGTTATSATSSTTAGVGGGGGSGAQTGSGGQGGMGGDPGLSTGTECTDDAECASGLCEPVLLDSNVQVCVSPCTDQTDCPTGGYFCEPITAGSPNGYCIPQSPAHCLSCETDADCGSLSEACIVGPNDEDYACHVDCSLSGEDGCPDEYTCEQVTVGNTVRELCMPNVDTCLDAIGGFCDRISIPQACERVNGAGSCLGQRNCLPGPKRFGACDADAPQCKMSCSDQDPAGCNQSYCPEATAGPQNCGMCGNVCPGFGQTSANVTCDGVSCGFSCKGEQYDVDGSAANGCEIIDSPTGNHSQGAATDLGSMPCNDGSSNPNITGLLPSDVRVHENPSVSGFSSTSGSAPDWYYIFGDGGFCQNDISLTLQVSGTGNLACYRLRFNNSDGNYSCATNASGTCTISSGSGSYAENSAIYLIVDKICTPASNAGIAYTVTGHL